MSRLAVFLICVAFVSACGGGKSNVEPPAPLVDFTATASVKRVWSVDVGKGEKKKLVTLSPRLHAGTVYVADPAGRVSAFAADNGRRVWIVDIKEPVSGAVGYGEGLVLLGTKQGDVIALQSDSGEVYWKSAVSSEVLVPPIAASGIVVAQAIDGQIFGISARDGERLWSQRRDEPSLSLRGTSAPVINRGLVLSGFAGGKIVAFDLQSGRPVWERTVAHPRGRSEIERLVDVDAAPLVVGGVVFAASYQGKLVAIDMETGRVLWSREASSYTGMDADQQNIYLTDDKSHVLALDQRSGAGLWKQDKLQARAVNAPTLVAGYVAVGDLSGYVHWLSKDTGQFAARTRIDRSPIRGKAVAAADTLFVQSQKGMLSALRIRAKGKRSR